MIRPFLFYITLAIAAEGSETSSIAAVLQQWPKDFNAGRIEKVCSLFAPDLIASYPGTPDRTYDEMCRQLTEAMRNSKKNFRYQSPQIEQILIEGDVAVVRLIWTATITEEDKILQIQEKGLDIFRRQHDGSWKIVISYAYPLMPDRASPA